MKKLFKPRWAIEWWDLIRREGIRSFIRQKGWKVFVAFILFYLVRDVTLYIIIPYYALGKISGCS